MAQNNLFEQMRIRTFIEGWQRYTIEKWQKELRKKGIGVTDKLYNSFEKDLSLRSGEILESTIKFLMYGRFRDMNVGKGLKAFERTGNTAARTAARRYGVQGRVINRVQKRWINKINAAQTYRLSEIIGIRASEAFISDYNTTLNVTING